MMFLHAPMIRKSLARLLCGVSAAALFASAASATPANGTFVAGGAGGSITPSGGDVTINTGTDPRSIITWDSFNIDNGDTVIFNQLNNQSIALNKVTGPLAQSTIDGILQSNGHVWILNPAGVAFGANANIDVGALLATTADIDNAAFMATDPTTGTFTFTDAGGTGAIIVANGADLDTTGLLALVAPMVTNSGDLTSSHGDVLLGGAEAFRIKFASTARNNGAAFNELLVTDFIIDGGSSTAAAGGDVVHQTSTGRAIGGRVIADASRVGGGAFLNMEGLVEAQNVGTLSGDVMLLGGVDITAGVLGATATDAVKTDNMTIVAPGTATVQGTAVTIGSNAGPLSTGGGGSSTGSVAITATTGDATVAADIQATAGDISVQAANGNIDVGQLIALGSIDVSGRDIDLTDGNATGVTTVLRTTNGALSLTATNGDISKGGGIVDIDVGTNVTLSGNAAGATSAWVIDAVPGTVTTDDVNVQFLRIGATGSVGVGDVTASQSAEVVSTGSTVKVGNVSSDNNITLSGTDIDLTGTGGSLQSTGGTVSVTATGGGANNISATGAIDIDADAVSLSGTTTGTSIDIDADNGTVTANTVTASAGAASIDATGNVDVDDVSATTTARVVSSTGAVDVGNVTGPGGITVSGTDVDLTGTGGSLQSSGGTVSVTASGGGANNISATGAIDIDGDAVSLSGTTTGTSIDIDADNGTVTANALTATGTSVTIDATGDIDVDDVTGTATGIARVVSSSGAVDVGDVTGTLGVTISGTDVDLTGTNGKVIAAGGVTSITATGGGANNISSAGAMDIDGAVVTLSGVTSAVGNLDITSAAGTTAGDVSGGGVVVVRSVAGPVDVDNVTGTGTVQVTADANAVDVGNVTGPGGITISGTDVDLTGTGGSLQSTGGTVSVTATGGGANNISATGAIDIDGDVVTLSGPVTGTAVDIDADNGGVAANAVTASAGSASVDATGNVDVDDVSATTTARVVSSSGAVDVGNVAGPGGITISGTDIDLTGTGGSLQSTGGTVSVTASGGGANNISAAGAIDIDGDIVTLSGPVTGTAVDIDADNGGVTANAITASAGSASVDATGNVDVDDVSSTTTARIVSSAGAVDVGNVTGPGGITISGSDVDLTGTGGSVQSSGGIVSITASGGGANNISSAGAIDIDGDVVSLSGTTTGTSVDVDADNGTVTANNVSASAGSASIDATGDVDVDDVSATTSVRVVSSTGAVDVGDVSAVTQADISGTDVDLTGANGSVQVTTGPANLTATGGGANNISAAGAIDIDAHQVNLSGATTAMSIDIDATNGPVTGNALSATAGSVSVDASNGVDVDDVTATTSVRVVSTLGAVDVGNVSGPAGVTISGTDIDLTGAGGLVQSANGITSLAATGGGANNVSSAGAMDIDGNSIVLSGPVVGGGAVSLTADTTDISSTGVVDVTGTSVTVNGPVNGTGGVALSATTGNVSADSAIASAGGTVALSAVNGDIDVMSVSGATGATFVARDVDVTGSVNGGTGPAALTATAGDISTPGILDIDGGSISLAGPVQAGTGIDLDASTGGITATADMTSTAGSADLRAVNGAISVQGVKAPDGVSIVGATVNYFGMLMTQGQVFLEALTGALTGSGTSSVAAPNGGLTARALGGAATLNNVVIGGDLSVVGGSATMTGASTVGGTATLQALTGNVHVAGSVAATGGILLIEAPSGAAVINSIASNSDVSLVVLDLDLTGTISAGDQFNLTPAGTGRTIIIGGSGGTDGVTLRRPQGFTLDASEVTRIIASKLQINAGANDLALLDATFDPAALQSLFLGADANARIIAAGNVTGLPHLQLGFLDGATNARPGLILVSGALGRDTAADRLASLRLESSEDIVIGTQAFLDEFERAGGNLDLSLLGEPDLARFAGTQDHVFIAADQLRLFAPGEIVQLNTGTSFVGAGVVFGEAPAGEGTIVNTGGGPERVNLFGTVIRSTGERVTSFEAGLEPNLLGPGLSQNGELRLNLCVIGDSSSCSIAILREAQESARSRNSALSSLTHSTLFGFEDDDDDDDEEEDLGGVAGSGNEGLWGVGLP